MTPASDIAHKLKLPAGVEPPAPSKVSLIFPAYNRLEFTRQSWAALMANTDWSLVEEFHVYDDGSTDGTHEFLEPGGESGRYIMDQFGYLCIQYHRTSFRSPMGVTLDWIRRSSAPLLAKLDNDTIYPPGWLNVALDVMARFPKLDMLGLECMRQPVPVDLIRALRSTPHGDFGYLPAPFVSGLGIYRRASFERGLPQNGGYFGFEEWMKAGGLKCGWIVPSLPVFLLDRMCIEPWRSLSRTYEQNGWQRQLPENWRYKLHQDEMWKWWRPIE